MLARSAIAEGTKIATASSEILRRLKRTSTMVGTDRFEAIIRKYMDDLAAMGFNHQWRKKVLGGAMTGYRRILFREAQGTTSRNRLGGETAVARRVRKLCGKTTWFTKKKVVTPEVQRKMGRKGRTPISSQQQEKVTETAMFIPITKNSRLKNMLQEEERKHKGFGTVRYVERGGTTIERLLHTKDPWAGDCKRPDCFLCTTGKPGACMKQGLVYNIMCMICSENGRKTNYIGETARTCYDRGVEHLDAVRRGDEGHPLVEHQQKEHIDEPSRFQMKVERFQRSALVRQCTEGDMIANYKGDNLLNKKGE